VTYIEDLAARIRSFVPPQLLPDDDVDSLFLIYAALGLAKGEAVTRRDVHNAWAAWMAARKPSHESIRPFDDLDQATRAEDDPFVSAIRRAVRETLTQSS
jgi:hypothetical protein